MWLAERVWEPGSRPISKRAGSTHLLDDYHFLGSVDEILSAATTPPTGRRSIGLFPISEELRYLIPLRGPEET